MPRIPVHLPDDAPETLRELPPRLGTFDGRQMKHASLARALDARHTAGDRGSRQLLFVVPVREPRRVQCLRKVGSSKPAHPRASAEEIVSADDSGPRRHPHRRQAGGRRPAAHGLHIRPARNRYEQG